KRLCEPLINCYRFVDNYLSDRVHLGRQVLSLDDQRYTFHPEVWNQWKLLACDGKQSEVKKAQAAPQSQDGGSLDQSLVRRAEEEGAVYVPCTNVDQAWFSGVHSNVGGGYPKRGMDYVTLQW